jgi:hypothetical protein
MRIKLWIADSRDGEVLEELGTCLTDNPTRAAQMYESDTDKWEEKGYWAEVKWQDITDPAAVSLGRRGGSRTSDAKTQANRAKSNLPPKEGKKPRGIPSAIK